MSRLLATFKLIFQYQKYTTFVLVTIDRTMILFSDKKYRLETLAAIAIIVLFFCLFYQKLLQAPSHFLVTGGDGMKNYYTFMYHVKHDSTYMGFEGMNYPFGENIIFTDNQPLLANATKWLANFFPSMVCDLSAIHNLALLFGLCFGALGLFFCFRTLKLDVFFALVATCGLMLIHPQADRIHGHFAMFYPLMPWLFWLWLRIWKGEKPLFNFILAGVLITLSGLLHMYFFITGAIMALLATLVWVAGLQSSERWKHLALAVGVQVVLPYLILHFFSSYFNPAMDRPTKPWGFFSYHSYWEGLFFSYKLPLFHFINDNIIKVRNIDFEGKSYVGILAVSCMLYGIFLLLLKTKSTIKWIKNDDINFKLLIIFVLSACISFGYPFTITGLDGLWDYSGPFRQFRSIGRVAWISFYAINLWAIPMIYHWLKDRASGVKRAILYFSILSILLIEGTLYFKQRPLEQTDLPAYSCASPFQLQNVHAKDYQALLPNPYFNIGSECFSWSDQANNVSQNFEISYNMGLPTMGVNMSRTALHQAMLLNELTCLPYKVPDIITLLKKKDLRPLLVVESKAGLSDPRAKLDHWTKNTPIVFENEHYRLRRLELMHFDSIAKKFNDSLATIVDTVNHIVFNLDFQKVKSQNKWGYESYIEKTEIVPGAYTLSYWIDAPDATRVHSVTEVWTLDGLGNHLDYIGEANRFNYKKIEGQKLLIQIPVNVKSGTIKIIVRISKDRQKQHEDIVITKPELKK